jgi:hypothetical protein
MKSEIPLLMALALAVAPAPALAQSNSCVDCHVANGGEPWAEHQGDWDISAHSRGRVTCEKCHGGDATAFDVPVAHAAVLPSSNPAAPTHRGKLPETCGRCHPGPRAAFEKSRHHERLRGGDAQAPSCSTCHGAVAARLPSPKLHAATCDGCHGEGKAAARPERAARASVLLARIQAARDELRAASARIRQVSDAARRHRLEEAYEEAQGPLTQAVHASHGFVFDGLEERLALSRRRSEALLAELAAPAR